MSPPPTSPPGVFDVLSRKTYWTWVGIVAVVLVVLSVVGGLYNLEISEMDLDPDAPQSPAMQHRDPLAAFLFSRVGLVVILAVFQFFAANLLVLAGAWGVVRLGHALRRRGASDDQ